MEQFATVDFVNGGRVYKIYGKIYKRYDKGLTVISASGLIWYATYDRVVIHRDTLW